MSVARSIGEGLTSVATLSDGRVLWDGDGGDTAEIYDPRVGGWSPTARMNMRREGAAAAGLPDDRFLAAGGESPWTGTPGGAATAEIYDPRRNRWSFTDPMPHGGGELHWAVLDNGRVLVQAEDSLAANVYDDAAAEGHHWRETGRLAISHGDGADMAPLPGGRALLLGGSDWLNADPNRRGLATNDAEIYDSASNTWTQIAPPPTPLTDHRMATMSDGTVLIAAGSPVTGGAGSTQSLLYDPRAPTPWVPTGSLAVPRAEATELALVPCGALLTGGETTISSATTTSAAELYVPEVRAWVAAAPMTSPRAGHALVPLPDGTVLAAGGYSGAVAGAVANTSNTAELYTPAPCPPLVTGVAPSWGYVDESKIVTVTGRGFSHATTVAFGDSAPIPRCPAPNCFSAPSDSTITVTTPFHSAGQVHVTVAAPGTTSPNTPLDLYEYRLRPGCTVNCLPPQCPPTCPAPVVSSISPSSGPVPGGTRVRVSGSHLDHAARVHFSGLPDVTALCSGTGSGTSPCFSPDPVAPDGLLTVYTPAAPGPERVHITLDTSPGSGTLTSAATAADLFDYQAAGAQILNPELARATGTLGLQGGLTSTQATLTGGSGGTGGTPPAPPSMPGQAPAPVMAPGPASAPLQVPSSWSVTNPGVARLEERESRGAAETSQAMTRLDQPGPAPLLPAAALAGLGGCLVVASRRGAARRRRPAVRWAW